MARSPVCALPLVAALWLAAPAAPALAQTGRVHGVAKDDTGRPLKGVTVVAENADAVPLSFSAVTDDKGRFAMIGLRSGVWTLTASAPGYQPHAGLARVQTFGVHPGVEFRLQKAAPVVLGALAGVNAKELLAGVAAADHLLEGGKYDEAIAAYRALGQRTPALTAINLQIGRAYRAKGDFDAALVAFRAMLDSGDIPERATLEIGVTELARGELTAAENTLRRLADSPAAGAEALCTFGAVKLAQRLPAEAVTYLTRAVETDPRWSKPHYQLALAAIDRGDTADAIARLEKFLSLEANPAATARARETLERLKNTR